jgi:hypothetical protein
VRARWAGLANGDILSGLHATLATEAARRIGAGGVGEQPPGAPGDTQDVSSDGSTFTADVAEP